MKINPQTAPLYGECLLTVQLSEEEREDEEDVEFYLMFTGTTQRHLTTTLRVSHVTLQAVCPAHDRGETVQVTLCQARPGGAIDPVAEDHFQFVQDLALDMAHFLVKAAAHKDGLEGAMLLDECHIPLQECERLDETLALALRHLPLPTGWSVLGTDLPTQPGTERGPHDTLLHFAARRGLRRVALFLLQQPGGRDALHFTNQQGHTPARLAQKRGHAQLQHLLSEIENSPRPETKATRRRVPGGRVLLHHPVLNTYTLTVDRQPDAPPPDLRADVEELQRLIGSHCGQKGVSLTEQPTVSLILSRDLCDDLPLGVETSCVGPTSPRTLGPDREEEISSPSARSSDAVGVGTHAGPYPNGTVEHDQSEEADPAVAGSAVEGCGGRVPGGSSQERVAVGAASCATQQLEEADNEPGVAPSRRPDLDRPVANHSRAESQVRKTIQSDCELEGIMGQSHGLLPTAIPQGAESETGDLPGEREGEDTVPSTAAPHTGLPEDSGRAEETRRCAGGAENSPSDGTIASRAGQETGPCSEAVQQAVESRKEDPGNRGDPTDDCSCGPEAPASARTRRELEESLAEGLQPNMVSGPDPNAVRDASPQPLCLPVSSAAPVEQHQIDLPPVDTAPQGLEHTSTSDLSNDVTSSDVTGKAGHRDDGGLYSVLNEEKRPTLSASEPHDVISVFSGEEKCSDGKPVGQAPPSQNDPYERETGSESRPATGLSSTPARDEAVVGETPSAGKEEAARSETEPCQDIHTTSTAGQQPDRAEPPSPPSGVDPTLGHPTPSVDHVCRSQAGPAGSRPGVTEDSGVRETEAMEETRVTEVTEENKMTEEPGVTEEIGEECVNLPTAPIAVPAGGCERKETSAPPCDRPPSPPSCHEPQSEVVTSSVTSGVPVERETTVSGKITVSDGPVSCLNTSSDSGVTLDSTFASDPLSVSTQVLDPSSPLDVDSGTALHMDTSSPLEVNSGSAQDLPPSHNDGNLDGACESKSPEEDTSPPTVERVEGPPEDQLTDEPSDSTSGAEGDPQISFKHMDQSEVHREPEVFCPVEEVCTSSSAPSTGECLCVSESSLPESDSISDGDSLLGPDNADDGVFKQAEDSVTLTGDSTSGISLTGSISTDDSSSIGTWGLTAGSDTTAPASSGDPPLVGGAEEEERQDHLTEVPERALMERSGVRSLSPARRHSWGPSQNSAGQTDTVQRSVVQNEEGVKSAGHRRSMSWCPSDVLRPETDEMNARSYSLEGLSDEREGEGSSRHGSASTRESGHTSRLASEERGSLVSLTEEEHEYDPGDGSSVDSQRSAQGGWCAAQTSSLTLTKSASMSAICPRDLDDCPPLSGTLENSISEEEPGPLRSDSEARVGGTKVSRTFSYLKSKMSKKSKEKDRERNKDGKEKEKKSSSGHIFSPALTPPPNPCLQCNKPINTKDALLCTGCNAHVHKTCKDAAPVCTKGKAKQQQTVPDSAMVPGIALRNKGVVGFDIPTSALARERPRTIMLLPDDQAPPSVLPSAPPPRKSSGIMALNNIPLSKSISISNITGQLDDVPLKALKLLSQSTDSLNKGNRVNESLESLTDEGTEMLDSQLLGDFEADVKELEADSWSFTVDKKFLKQLKKDEIKRQDVIYELIQTEMHHVRTLHIMADVYSKGLQKEVQLESHAVEKMFPMLTELMDLHTHFFTHLVERKKEARKQRPDEGGFVIRRIGDVLLAQVSGSNAETMKKIYGKFCSRHNEAVNLYKELHSKDKRFQAFIKKKMSSSVVRRLSIPECILLVTQRLTKYPVLLQRILQHTRDPEEEQADVTQALRQVKEVIAAVDAKVSEYEKRKRLKEVHSRTDSKSIMRMKSGQMFAREDLLRGRRLLHDGPLQLKNAAGRLKDVQALLLSDVFVFLQEKDQKYVFAPLDQRSTVISLQKLIVREVANEERGLFLISAGTEQPEMVEVHASSREERNTWIQLIQDATHCIEEEEDEGIPSENEEDKRAQENKVKEMKDQLQRKDEQIVALLEDKVRLFRDLCDCPAPDDSALQSRMLFRATPDDVTKGEQVMKDSLKEVGVLQELVGGMLGTQQMCVGQEGSGGSAGPPGLPRRAETFAGFDSHQMNISKNGEEADESADLRRTESDSVLKKGGSANLLLLKRNREQVLHSVTRLHDLLNTLQAVVVQQDSFIEEQRHTLSERLQSSSRHASVSSSSSSSSSSRPGSLIEQEKQRCLERQRQEAAALQRQRAAHSQERRRREGEWAERERELTQREARLHALEEETHRRRTQLEEETQELRSRKEEYQRDLARLRDSQRRLERDREQLYAHTAEEQLEWRHRTPSTSSIPSTVSEDSLRSVVDHAEPVELASSPAGRDLLARMDSKRKAKTLNPFTSSSSHKGGAAELQGPSRLLQLAKPKKEKKKKKGKQGQPTVEGQALVMSDESIDGQVFC